MDIFNQYFLTFSIEFNKDIAKTYEHNFPKNHLIIDDIKNISNAQIKKLQGKNKIDVIVGGPPCQGFSIAGNIGRKFVDDPRNHLLKEFVRVVNVIRPRMFVMENVARILHAFVRIAVIMMDLNH